MANESMAGSKLNIEKPHCHADRTDGIDRPLIGMLCWEAGLPRGLKQLETLPGNVINPATFNFPLRYERVRGANIHTILEEPSVDALHAMIKVAQGMEEEGIRAITTSCGFNAIFQSELANSVSIPVFTSSLMQVPMVHRMLKKGEQVGIITASKASLTDKHLEEMGIHSSIAICIEGLENTGEFDKILNKPEKDLDLEKLEAQVIQVAKRMLKGKKTTGAIVLECTDLPPFAHGIQQAMNVPVFDIVSLVNMVQKAIAREQ